MSIRLTQTNKIHDQDSKVCRHVFEIGELNPRPKHQVLLVSGEVGVSETLADAGALEVGHAGEEEAHVDGREDELIGGDASADCGRVRGADVDVFRQEAVPFCGCGAKDCWIASVWVGGRLMDRNRRTATIDCHTGSTHGIMLLYAPFLNGLLSKSIACREENLEIPHCNQQCSSGNLGFVRKYPEHAENIPQ